MILAQFQSFYPTGALITELLQISHGQYIVRTTVQIEGAIRSTGMASAPTVEEAEDKARERALMILGILNTSTLLKASSEENSKIVQKVNQEQSNKAINQTKPEISETVSQRVESQLASPLEIIRESTSNQAKENQPALEERDLDIAHINYSSQSDNKKSPEIKATKKTNTKKVEEYEPLNQSDDIAKISAEMQRLGWTMEQGRDYLMKTYDKRSRHLLSEEELKNFLEYLQSQTIVMEIPDDIDPLSEF